MSPADHWDALEQKLDDVAEVHLTAIRDDAPAWAKLAVTQHQERAHRLRSKLAAARKVLGQ